MSASLKNLTVVLSQLRALYLELAKLIETADSIMLKNGWKSQSAQCVSLSYTVGRPEAWFPDDVYHFFLNEDFSNLIAFVSATLTDRDAPDKLKEPVLCAGVFDFGGQGSAPSGLEAWYAHIYGFLEIQSFNPEIQTYVQREKWPSWKRYFETVSLISLPLVEVGNTDDLQNKLIHPLLEYIGAHYGESDDSAFKHQRGGS